MTVEERTKNVIDKTTLSGWEHDTLFKEITQALRDQIKECAKIADVIDNDLSNQRGATTNAKRGIARTIGRQIRALAAPGESNQEKGD